MEDKTQQTEVKADNNRTFLKDSIFQEADGVPAITEVTEEENICLTEQDLLILGLENLNLSTDG